jgi:hypothetical protein
MKPLLLGLSAFLSSALICSAVTTYEDAGATAASITAMRDSFRAAIGGGNVAGADGNFGGLRREINWDGVPTAFSDPNPLPGDFFNVNSPRGVVLSTPGLGFLVSANAGGATPVLFGFPNDFQPFSPQKLFTPVSSNVTDVRFFIPGTTTAATTSAFGLVFVDVEVEGVAKVEFFDTNNNIIFSRDALVAGNQGLSFLGGVLENGDALISRVRIISGQNTITGNGILGNPNSDVVVMDDFIYAVPSNGPTTTVPDSGSVVVLLGLTLVGLAAAKNRFTKRC